MTEILVKSFFALAVVFIAIYYSVIFLSNKQSELHQELESDTAPTYTEEEKENIKLAEELYDKDLRTSPQALDTEVVTEEVVKPAKKKRKYYPKKKK